MRGTASTRQTRASTRLKARRAAAPTARVTATALRSDAAAQRAKTLHDIVSRQVADIMAARDAELQRAAEAARDSDLQRAAAAEREAESVRDIVAALDAKQQHDTRHRIDEIRDHVDRMERNMSRETRALRDTIRKQAAEMANDLRSTIERKRRDAVHTLNERVRDATQTIRDTIREEVPRAVQAPDVQMRLAAIIDRRINERVAAYMELSFIPRSKSMLDGIVHTLLTGHIATMRTRPKQ